MPTLMDSLRVGALTAPNRIFMAPLTRARGTRDHIPTEVMTEYYAQRASAGLIISEAIGISQQGLGWPYATGLWLDEQIAGWRKVTNAVHEAGGRIVAQLWHMGRVVHPSFNDDSAPVSASPTRAPGHAHTYGGNQRHAEAHELTIPQIESIVGDYARAAANAMDAGFDGVQLHAANGYLVDQFIKDTSNFRVDEYGGSVENRLRFLLEVTHALCQAVGADRVGVRLSPSGVSYGIADSRPGVVFPAAAAALSELRIAFLEVREPAVAAEGEFPIAPLMRPKFRGVFVRNMAYDADKAKAAVESGAADAVTFGRLFIANPDLPFRLANWVELNEPNSKTFYTQGPEGYVDYPFAPEDGLSAD